MKDRGFHIHEKIEEAITVSILRTFRASSTTGCGALHGSLNMRESIFLNKNQKVSFYWVDVEIRRGRGLSLHPVLPESAQSGPIGRFAKMI
jgi:hypothetical protein